MLHNGEIVLVKPFRQSFRSLDDIVLPTIIPTPPSRSSGGQERLCRLVQIVLMGEILQRSFPFFHSPD